MCAGNGNSLLSPLFGALGTLFENLARGSFLPRCKHNPPYRKPSWARRHCESAVGTSRPRGFCTFRLDIALFLVLDMGHSRLSCRPHTFGLVDIIPRALSSQDIFDFLLLHILAFVVALVDDKVVGAGEALEAVLADKVLGGRVTGRDSRDAQHVAACWAD